MKPPLETNLGKSKLIKDIVNEHEKELAKKLGGVRQPNSGAGPTKKGDIKTQKFLFDSKESFGSEIKIRGIDLIKISREAFEDKRIPALIIKLHKVGCAKEWVLIELETFNALT